MFEFETFLKLLIFALLQFRFVFNNLFFELVATFKYLKKHISINQRHPKSKSSFFLKKKVKTFQTSKIKKVAVCFFRILMFFLFFKMLFCCVPICVLLLAVLTAAVSSNCLQSMREADDRLKGEEWQTQKKRGWMAGQVRMEELLAKASHH